MDKLSDAIAILAFGTLLTAFVIVPVAFPIAIFSYFTGIVVAPWIATAIAFPISVYMARNALSSL